MRRKLNLHLDEQNQELQSSQFLFMWKQLQDQNRKKSLLLAALQRMKVERPGSIGEQTLHEKKTYERVVEIMMS